jgi:hypothetical protein
MTAAVPLRSASLRAKLALIRGHSHGRRASFFRDHKLGEAGNDPDIAMLVALPDWIALMPAEQARLAIAVAVLLHRPAIDQLLSGNKLAALSDAIGENLFDDLCDYSLPASISIMCSNHLPRPEDLEAIGREHMLRAIPTSLAARFPGAAGDDQAALLCTIAAQLFSKAAADT